LAKNVAVAKDFLKFVIQPNVVNEYLKTGLCRRCPTWPRTNRSGFEVSVDRERLIGDLTRQAQWASAEGLTKPGTKLPDFETVVVDDIFKRARSV
jgi:hypothetical protein